MRVPGLTGSLAAVVASQDSFAIAFTSFDFQISPYFIFAELPSAQERDRAEAQLATTMAPWRPLKSFASDFGGNGQLFAVRPFQWEDSVMRKTTTYAVAALASGMIVLGFAHAQQPPAAPSQSTAPGKATTKAAQNPP